MPLKFRSRKRRASEDVSKIKNMGSNSTGLKKRAKKSTKIVASRTRRSSRQAPFPTVPIQMHTLFKAKQQKYTRKAVTTRSQAKAKKVSHRICGRDLCPVNCDPMVYTIKDFLTGHECDHLLSIVSQRKKQR